MFAIGYLFVLLYTAALVYFICDTKRRMDRDEHREKQRKRYRE